MLVQLSGGVTIQVRGWSSSIRSEDAYEPEWGLYLDEGSTERITWPSRFIRWPDFGVPCKEDEGETFDAIDEAWSRAGRGECIEVGCTGGTGRTGTVLACLTVLAGRDASDAIEWVRSSYHPEAVETRGQERFVDRFAAARGRQDRKQHPVSTATVETSADTVALLRDLLLGDLDRWEPELANWGGTRCTLWYGIFDKACKRVEALISASTREWLARSPDVGDETLLTIGRGKPLERLTLGQQLDILRTLNARRATGPRIPKPDLDRVERIVTKRNEFEHGRLDYGETAIDVTLAFLSDARSLCQSPVIRALST